MENTHSGSKKDNANKVQFFLGFFSGLALISVVGFFILLGVMLSGGESFNFGADAADTVVADQPAVAPTPDAPAAPVKPIDEKEEYVLGDPDAEVQLIIYDDFECPFCLRHADTVKQINQEYGDDVAIVIRHFPLSFHPEAQKAAEASECAGEQGEFWAMHDKLFEAQANGTMSVTQYKADAKAIGLKTSKFNDCLDEGKYASKVTQQQAEAVSFGVNGTPGNFLNGQLISGAVPFAQFKAAIDSILN
jgi:protein-disulfide isomerase